MKTLVEGGGGLKGRSMTSAPRVKFQQTWDQHFGVFFRVTE